MNTDLRISVDLADHPKVKLLVKAVGEPAFRCLVRLWGAVARMRPGGTMTGWRPEDIEDEAGWQGEPGQFFAALYESTRINPEDRESVGLIERDAHGRWQIHDWQEHNFWAAQAPARREAARKAALKRWSGTRGPSTHIESQVPKEQRVPTPSEAGTDNFVELYNLWPKKKSRQASKEAYERAIASAEDPLALHRAMMRAAKDASERDDWTQEGGRYAPPLATWIADEGWTAGASESEPEVEQPNAPLPQTERERLAELRARLRGSTGVER